MNLHNRFLILLLLVSLSGCIRKADDSPFIPPEGSINLSDLQTKHDYYLPFSIVNNSADAITAVMNDTAISFKPRESVVFRTNWFWQLVTNHIPGQPNDTFLFTTKTSEREASEWGIRAWIPVHYSTVSLSSEEVEIYYPRRYTGSVNIPFVFYVKESGSVKPVYCNAECTTTGDHFNIKRGVGSVNIGLTSVTGEAGFTVGGKQINVSETLIRESPVVLQGTIASPTDIPANSYVKITGNLDITAAGSLTIHEGTLVVIDEAVDINVSGPVIFSGTADNPVLITCSLKDKFWGGFITRVTTGSINAKYTIFCRSGYHMSGAYNWGHSGRQALFYTENSTLDLDHCFMLDHIGQVFYPQNSTLNFNHILVQRVQTGGQVNSSNLTLRNSHFTDFPEESDTFLDLDNDALYLSASDAVIDSTTFMFAKDDGLDSGNNEGGTISVTNCRFEACFHEGAALSSGYGAVKNHTFSNCVFFNCGQGLEMGFSSPNHNCLAENCQFLDNGVGIRYGDNYDWANVEGKMHIKNSVSLNNDRDVWNMVRGIWRPKLQNLTFENTKISKRSSQYPDIPVVTR